MILDKKNAMVDTTVLIVTLYALHITFSSHANIVHICTKPLCSLVCLRSSLGHTKAAWQPSSVHLKGFESPLCLLMCMVSWVCFLNAWRQPTSGHCRNAR